MVLEDQVVFITGASRGFGFAATEELLVRGHRVAATMRNPDRDGPAVRALDPERVEVFRCDVTDRVTVDSAVEGALERFGRIDTLFNNAGYGLYGPVEDLSESEIMRELDTNFVGQIRVAQAVLPAMREQRSGKIINVSSLAGRIVGPLMGLYSASKWAVEAMSEALRYEVSRWGVDVTILEPGMYASDWQTTNLDVAATPCARAAACTRSQPSTRWPSSASAPPRGPARAASPRRSPTSSSSSSRCRCAGRSARTPCTRSACAKR